METENKFKRNIAYKLRVGEILEGSPILEEEKFKHLQLGERKVVRINLIANIIEKYIQDNEKKYASITLDDSTGQIKIKSFGEDIEKFKDLIEGDTLLIVGLLRSWNNEIYITPEIIKKKDPSYLLLRKLEIEKNAPKTLQKEELTVLKDKIISLVKENEKNEGIEVEKIILEMKEPPEIINREIKKLLEEGVAYEPRPGKLRYLG